MIQLPELGLALRCQGNPSSLIDSTRLAENVGFESVWLVEVAEADVIALAGSLSQATAKIKIATGVANSCLRLPTLLAQSALTISELSKGRFILGVGAGHAPMSYVHSYSEDRNPTTRLRETIQILRSCFSGDTIDFRGKLYHVRGFKLGLQPSHEIPIFGAAMGPKMVQLVAEIADGMLLMMPTIDYLEKLRKIIDSVVRDKGPQEKRQLPIACHLVTAVSEDHEEAERTAKKSVVEYINVPIYRNSFERMGFKEVATLSKAIHEKRIDAWRGVPTEMIERLIVYGTPEECVRKIRMFVDHGVTQPVVYPCMTESGFPNNANETIRLLAPFISQT